MIRSSGAAEKLARKDKLGIWGDPGLAEKYLRLKSKWGQGRSRTDSSAAVTAKER